MVFEELCKTQLFINGKKSEFFLEEIHYLGYIISKQGVRMDLAKIQAIKKGQNCDQCVKYGASWAYAPTTVCLSNISQP